MVRYVPVEIAILRDGFFHCHSHSGNADATVESAEGIPLEPRGGVQIEIHAQEKGGLPS